jgi:hypothetical protein
MSSDRRDFLKKVTAGAAGIAVGGSAMGMSAKSYSRIIGANDKAECGNYWPWPQTWALIMNPLQ